MPCNRSAFRFIWLILIVYMSKTQARIECQYEKRKTSVLCDAAGVPDKVIAAGEKNIYPNFPPPADGKIIVPGLRDIINFDQTNTGTAGFAFHDRGVGSRHETG